MSDHVDHLVSRLLADAAIPLHADSAIETAASHAAAFDAAADLLASEPKASISRTLESVSIDAPTLRVWMHHNLDANIPRSLEIHLRDPNGDGHVAATIHVADHLGLGQTPPGQAFKIAIGACRAAAASCRTLLDPFMTREAARRMTVLQRVCAALAIEMGQEIGRTPTKVRLTMPDPCRYARAVAEFDDRPYANRALPLEDLRIEGLRVRNAAGGTTIAFSPMNLVMTKSQLAPSPVEEIAMVRELGKLRNPA